MANKIIVLQGVPGSGKSTWAREFVRKHKDYVIVSRDSLRDSAGVYWVPERENYISDLEVYSIEKALDNNFNVIIDATNLNPKTVEKWESISKKHGTEIEYKEFRVSFEEAVRRDAERGQKGGRIVGVDVIRNFFKNYYPEELIQKDKRTIKEYDPKKEDVIVCDLDGTVALHTGRNPYDITRVKEDVFDPRMLKLLSYLARHLKIIFVSGREGTEQCVADTRQWISDNFMNSVVDGKICWDTIFRKQKDYRSDSIIKEEIFKNQIDPYYNIITVFDDRDRVVEMWRKNGVLCSQVYYGEF